MFDAKPWRGDADHPCMVAKRGRKRTGKIQRTAAMCCVLAVLLPCRLIIATGETEALRDVGALVMQTVQTRELGQLQDAEALYRAVLALVPEHEKAYEGLVDIAGLRPLSPDSNSLRTTRALLPRRFRKHETKHYVILSDAGRRRARERGELLERTYEQFRRYAGRLDLRPLPLRNKLVCVLFRKRSDFAAFAREHDGVAATWCLGYYSPRHDRTVYFDVESERGADEFAEARAIAATVHEAIHHLHFHTGVQSSAVQYPMWFGEGIATAFETKAPGTPFGPEYDFAPRRERFGALLAAGRLLPLRAFVQLDRMPDERRQTIHTVYNQSYALASWLVRERPGEFRAYLFSMLNEPPGRPAPQRHLELFELAFGDVDAVEKAWMRQETALEDVP